MFAEGWGIVALGGALAFIANVLYQLGGISNKWLRRYLASFVLALAANLVGGLIGNWHWQYILMWPCLIGGFSLGYGGDTTTEKIIKRTIYALGVLMACVMGLWAASFSGAGITLMIIAAITGLGSVVLGVVNPFTSARVEEFLVCQVLTLFIPFWAYVRIS
jgi:hypothetical protein